MSSAVKARVKFVRISPTKLQRVARLVRGRSVLDALNLLKHIPHKGARILYKGLHSAMSNATHNNQLNQKDLVVSAILVNEGPRFKRFQPKARGRIHGIIKRTSHLDITLRGAE